MRVGTAHFCEVSVEDVLQSYRFVEHIILPVHLHMQLETSGITALLHMQAVPMWRSDAPAPLQGVSLPLLIAISGCRM